MSPLPRPLFALSLAGALVLAAGAALADDDAFCPERPGQTTPPCVLAPGGVMLETAATSWTIDDHAGARSDTVLVGQSQIRVGLIKDLEVQAGWTPLGVTRERDGVGSPTFSRTGVGDASFGLLYGLTGPAGPVSLQGFVTAPVGTNGFGAGDWGAGARLPVAFALSKRAQIGLTPEIDAEVNSSGSGRHLAFGGAVGLGYALTDAVQLGADLGLFRHEDPAGATTTASVGTSLAWQVGKRTQLDIGGLVGLNRDTPNGQIYIGIAHRF